MAEKDYTGGGACRRMAQYEAFDDDVHVRGAAMKAVLDDALPDFSEAYRDRAYGILADEGIPQVAPDEWYPQQSWLNAFRGIARELEPHLLDRLGERTHNVAGWPSDAESVAEGLCGIDDAYRYNHRGGEVGTYAFEATGDREGVVRCRNPYPCVFDRGLIRGVAREYAPVDSFVFVEETGTDCRRDGADACSYTVHW